MQDCFDLLLRWSSHRAMVSETGQLEAELPRRSASPPWAPSGPADQRNGHRPRVL